MKNWLGKSLGRWFFFNVILALLQLWVLIAFRWLKEENVNLGEILLDGALIFYANSIAMSVLERRLDEMRLISGIGQKSDSGFKKTEREGMFLSGIVVPFITLILSVTMYCVLLSSKKLTLRTTIMECAVTGLALLSSVTHNLEVWKRFERADAGSGQDQAKPKDES